MALRLNSPKTKHIWECDQCLRCGLLRDKNKDTKDKRKPYLYRYVGHDEVWDTAGYCDNMGRYLK